MNICSICGKPIEREDAPVLTISGYGNPRYICDECEQQMDVAMSSRDVEEIEAVVKVLGDKMNASKDDYAVAAMYNFISVACDRLVKIKEGTYDFSIDEKMKELDKRDAEKQKKFDEIMNWVSLIAIGGTLIYVILSYLLK